MTVEVLLMNRTSVAMAADSAVSVTDGSRLLMSQSGIQKVFVLDGQAASGLMIYGLAEFCGCPWATIVEAFKRRGYGAEPTLAGITASLLSLLGSLHRSDLVSTEQTTVNFRTFVAYGVVDFFLHFHAGSAGAEGQANDALLSRALENLDHDVRYSMVDGDDGPQPVERGRIGDETPVIRGLIDEHLDDVLTRVSAELFGEGFINREVKERLAKIIVAGLTTTWLPTRLPATGMVIAGFGRDEISPCYFEIRMFGLVGDLLQHDYLDSGRLGPDLPVVIRSFAQDSAVNRFLYGADWTYQNDTLNETTRIAELLAQHVAENSEFDAKTRKAMVGLTTAIATEAVRISLQQASVAHFIDILQTFGQRVRSATNVEPLGALAGQLLGLPIAESELTGNSTVARPFSILRLSKGGASLTLEKELV